MTYTILIVEDEYLVRQGLTKLVNVAAYDMEIIGQAENGRQAWDLIQKQVPDIILTDINMPQLNGIQLARLVRETFPQVHLVFLTGRCWSQDSQCCYECRIWDSSFCSGYSCGAYLQTPRYCQKISDTA